MVGARELKEAIHLDGNVIGKERKAGERLWEELDMPGIDETEAAGFLVENEGVLQRDVGMAQHQSFSCQTDDRTTRGRCTTQRLVDIRLQRFYVGKRPRAFIIAKEVVLRDPAFVRSDGLIMWDWAGMDSVDHLGQLCDSLCHPGFAVRS